MRNGIDAIENIPCNIKYNGNETTQNNCFERIRTLVVYICPELFWDRQYLELKIKIQEAIGKLSNTIVSTLLTHVCANVHFMTIVYFGSGIIQLTPLQEYDLKKIYEEPILSKLKLGIKFPRKVLHSRAKALGAGLIKTSTALASDEIRVHMENKRQFGKTGKLIQTTEYNNMTHNGCKNSDIHKYQQNKQETTLWIQHVAHEMQTRKIEIINNDTLEITSNSTIIDFAQQFKTQKYLQNKLINMINHVRLFKQTILPFELVALQGNKQTETFQITTILNALFCSFS